MNYCGIYRTSIADGLGWRVVLFVSGCAHGCKGCHNKKAWNKEYGKKFTDETKELLFKELKKPEIDGITISGGEPLMSYNINTIEDLCKLIKSAFPNKNIWLYTGFIWEEIKHASILNYIDVVVDGKFDEDKKDITLPFKGSSNQRIINVKKSLEKEEVIEILN